MSQTTETVQSGGMSFAELYKAEKKKPTPVTQFLQKIAALTEREELTVRLWAYGYQEPDALVKRTLSEYFNVPAEQLFPRSARKGSRNYKRDMAKAEE